MAKVGRKPVPTAILEKRGSWRAKGREGEPVVCSDDICCECPAWLDDRAKAKWYEMLPILKNMGVIGQSDMDVLVDYCHWWSKFVGFAIDCPNDIHSQAKASDKALKAGAKLGLSPVDRVGLKTEKKTEKDKFFKIV